MSKFVEVKTAELAGPALDWAVATAEGRDDIKISKMLQMFGGEYYIELNSRWDVISPGSAIYKPRERWSQGGPLIEREKIIIIPPVSWCIERGETDWEARVDPYFESMHSKPEHSCLGDTPLIAAMRCFVSSKMGDVVQVPAELVGSPS